VKRVHRDFGDDAEPVLYELDRLPEARLRDADRLPAAILTLAKGDVPAVVGLVEQSLIDWREVLTWVDDIT